MENIEYQRQYRIEHPGYQKQWHKKHSRYNKQYRIENREYIRQLQKKWYIENREQELQYKKQYNMEHSERKIELVKKWRKNYPEKVRKIAIRQQKKRKRMDLGFNPLNKYFEGSEVHHINKNDVIYIPKKLHQSISHCLETSRNMKKINKLAMRFI